MQEQKWLKLSNHLVSVFKYLFLLLEQCQIIYISYIMLINEVTIDFYDSNYHSLLVSSEMFEFYC